MSSRYTERPSLRGVWVTLGLYLLLLAVTYVPVLRDGTFRPSDLALVPVLGLLALPLLALFAGKRRYSSVTVTATELVVGRARLPLAGLRPLPEDDGAGAPLLGGAFAAPLGWSSLVVEAADGRRWRVATRRPAELAAALQG